MNISTYTFRKTAIALSLGFMLIICLSTLANSFSLNEADGVTQTNIVRLTTNSAFAGEAGTFQIEIENSDVIYSGEITLQYNQTMGLSLSDDALQSERLSAFDGIIPKHFATDPTAATLTLSFFSILNSDAVLQPGSGAVFTVPYTLTENAGGTIPLSVTQVELFDMNNEPIEGVATEGGAIIVEQTIALESVTISGPSTGEVEEVHTFTASITPVDATMPITYEWSTDGLQSGQGTTQATYLWNQGGSYIVEVTASNDAGDSVSDSFTVEVMEIVPTPTPTTETPIPTDTLIPPTPTDTSTVTNTPVSPTPTYTPPPTDAPPSSTPFEFPTVTDTRISPTPTYTPTPTDIPLSPTPTDTPEPTATPISPTPTDTSTVTDTPVSPTPTYTPTPTDTPPLPTPTDTSTVTDTPISPTPTYTPAPADTPLLPTPTDTSTVTDTPISPMPTYNPTPTDTPPLPTPTDTSTVTDTPISPTPTYTPTLTDTPPLPTPTYTPTVTNTPVSPTPTYTPAPMDMPILPTPSEFPTVTDTPPPIPTAVPLATEIPTATRIPPNLNGSGISTRTEDTVQPNSILAFEVSLQNTGGEAAENVVVTVTLPLEVTYMEDANLGFGWEPVFGESNVYRLSIDRLLANTQRSLPIMVQVDPDAPDGASLIPILNVQADNVESVAGTGTQIDVVARRVFLPIVNK